MNDEMDGLTVGDYDDWRIGEGARPRQNHYGIQQLGEETETAPTNPEGVDAVRQHWPGCGACVARLCIGFKMWLTFGESL